MRLLACLVALAFTLPDSVMQGSVVQGVVLDDETGNPLARTLISLTPLPGTQAGAVSLRTGDRGAFTILSVRPGWYVLRAGRRGYAEAEAGQLRAGRPGTPFEIAPDAQSTFLQLRMRRLGAITGTVLDENNIGIPDWTVHLYTAKKPVRRLTEVKTDERGNFRIGSLDPASYVVRSGAGTLEDDTGLLPTYYKFGTALETSQPVTTRLGETTQDIAIRPVKGRLLEIGGVFSSSVAARLILITDTGRRQIASLAGPPETSVAFTATGVPPGPIELLAEGAECGSYTRIALDKDTAGIRIGCGPLYPTTVDWRPYRPFPVLVRRVDLDGTGPARTLRPRDPLQPGHWEVMAQTSADYYTTAIRLPFTRDSAGRNDGWFGIDAGNQTRLEVVLSPRPARISGVVSTGGKPVTGAAVYLEQFNPDLPDPHLQSWTVRSDPQGNYLFTGLPPGRYRVLSSFDFDPEDPFAMEKAAALSLAEGSAATQMLEMILP